MANVRVQVSANLKKDLNLEQTSKKEMETELASLN
jgi:predicted phage-related endonuclease